MVTEIVPQKLWSCAHNDIHQPHVVEKLINNGLRCIISILPAGRCNIWDINPKPDVHRVLVCLDDEYVSPVRIDYAVNLHVPTLIHCNAGKNRSTAVAACWLIKHCIFVYGDDLSAVPDRAIGWVVDRRTEALGWPPKISDVMRFNVKKYFKWLRCL